MKCPKLQKPWQGLHIIVNRINDLVYRIQLGPQSRPRVVHFNRLWKYHGENPPRWLITTGSNPTEAMESIGISSNDKVQSDVAAVSELPGYPGRRHMRESYYVTADFPQEAISTTDQGFARVWNR